MSGAPSALRGIHRHGVRNRNDILLLSVVYSLSYEAQRNTRPPAAGPPRLKDAIQCGPARVVPRSALKCA